MEYERVAVMHSVNLSDNRLSTIDDVIRTSCVRTVRRFETIYLGGGGSTKKEGGLRGGGGRAIPATVRTRRAGSRRK